MGSFFHSKTKFPFMKWALLLIAALGLNGTLFASHLLGGFIEYEYLSPYTYKFKIIQYRDCSGVTAYSSTTLNLQDYCTSQLISSATLPLVNLVELPSCDPSPSYCQGGTRLGIEMATYEGIVTIPATSCQNILVYNDECCRSANITNLVNAAATTMRLSTLINTSIANHSPDFTTHTTPYWCVGFPGFYSFNAMDVDGDSLAYSLANAWDTGIPAAYNAGTSPGAPVVTMAQGPNYLDPTTGLFRFMGAQAQIAVVGVNINEYRNGSLIGTQYREISIPIMPCSGFYCGSNTIEGDVYWETNGNCVFDGNDQGRQAAMIEINPSPYGPFYALPDPTGHYSVQVDSNAFTVSSVNLNPVLWSPLCPANGSYNVPLLGVGLTATGMDFGYQAQILCASPTVSIGTALIRPCSTSTYNVNYCNVGTDTAVNSVVTVELDPNFTYAGATIPGTALGNNFFEFPVGNLAPGFCGSFNLYATLACNPSLSGLTLCATATIDPHDPCTAPDPTWDRSSVSVTGFCNDSLACFTILNTGSPSNGNMLGTSEYRIFEDNILVYTGTFQLCGGCDTTICWLANGHTIRLEADQRPGHPGNSHPNDNVENCGTPNPARNFLLQAPLDDMDPFVDIYCHVVVNSFDPNVKEVVPTGIGPNHLVAANGQMEYTIFFQNLGTASAYSVEIRDTLDMDLDITTVQAGAASHPYNFTITGHRELIWTLSPINLPPASASPLGSIGYVKFTVNQLPNMAVGTIFENRAGIVFDQNPSILTPTVTNQIGENVMTETAPSSPTPGIQVKNYPNPSHGSVNIEATGIKAGDRVQVKVYNLMGKLVATQDMTNGKARINTMGWPQGIYMYEVQVNGKSAGFGKILSL